MASDSEQEEPPREQESGDPDLVRVLVSTDNHLGYNERDPVRGLDSFAAFEEVLHLARKHKCDMVLIAGDLFHHNKPSRRTLHKTMEIIRRYTMGPDAVQIQIVSDQATNFRSVHGTVNYEDEFYSVDLPIFSIHGNHDDPTREGGTEMLAALDLLAVSNMVNYFGRQDAVDKVEVSPILIEKGDTKIALYGMGSMRDERLNRMWRGKKVRFLKPEEDDWFHIFALHQNRDLGRGTKNCVHESMIPEWMDLVVWGHEHECLIDPSESVVGTFRITQPGSSVATSLTGGEAVRKQVGLLEIKYNQFRLKSIPLTQVRSFVMGEVSLQDRRSTLDPEDPKIDKKITAFLEEEVNVLKHEAIDKYQNLLRDAAAAGNAADTDKLKYRLQKPEEVLVRLKVEHSGYSTLNNQRFGAKFVGALANPSDVLLFHRRKVTDGSKKKKKSPSFVTPIPPEELEEMNVEVLIKENLELSDKKLKILSEERLGIAVEDFVAKEQNKAFNEAMKECLGRQQKELIRRGAKGGDEDDESRIRSAADVRETVEQESSRRHEAEASQREKEEEENGGKHTGRKSSSAKTKGRKRSASVEEEEDDDSSVDKENGRNDTAAGSKKRSPAAKPSSRRKKPSQSFDLSSDDDDDDDVMVVEAPKNKSARSNSRPSRRATNKSRVNYSVDEDSEDDFDISEQDMDDSDSEMEVLPKKKKSKASTSTKGKKSQSSRSTARSSSQRSKRAFEDDSDSDIEVYGVGGDWGKTNTSTEN
jgi:double-strand break repair protein MRE11